MNPKKKPPTKPPAKPLDDKTRAALRPHLVALAAAIGYAAEAAWHHPDLELGYARVKVKLQTHRVHGITTHDTALASRIEEIAMWTPSDDSPLDGFPKNWVK